MGKLDKISFFSALTAQERARLEEYSTIQKYASGENVFSEGDIDKDLFVILTGAFAVRKKISQGSKTVSILKEGEIFGEMALFENAPRSASVEAIEESEIVRINGDKFAGFLNENPKESFGILMKIIGVSSSRLRNTTAFLTTIYEIAKTSGSARTVEEISEKILAKFSEILTLTRGFFYVWNVFNEEWECASSFGENLPREISSDEVIEKLKEQDWALFSGTGENFFFSAVKEEGVLVGFLVLASQNKFGWEARILAGTVCNMTSSVISKLRLKKEEELRQYLAERKLR